ncbi:LysR family substrate-binding domain-containing protein, partial [Pseudomonas aeruginosa]
GRAFLPRAQRLLGDLEAARRLAREVGEGGHGLLRLGHSSSVPLVGGLQAALRGYLAAQSGVRLELTQQSSEQQLADLAEGRLDLGLLRLPVLRQHPRLHLRALYREPLLLALAADHPLARREAPVALAGETFVSIPHLQRGGLSYRAAELCLGAGFYPRPARALSRKTSQLQLIEAGFGVALVPASMRAIAPPAVRFMSLAEAEAYSEVALAWRRDDSPLVEGFVEYFLENLPNEAKD